MSHPLPRRFLAVPLLVAAWLPAACAPGHDTYPSLAPRPIERLSLAEPDRSTPAAAVAAPDATARYAGTIDKARAADADFRRTLEQERAALTKGRSAAEGSDAWTAAQESVSRVEAARAPVVQALSELDAARTAEPTHQDSGEAVATTQAFEQVHQIDLAEQAALVAVWPAR